MDKLAMVCLLVHCVCVCGGGGGGGGGMEGWGVLGQAVV